MKLADKIRNHPAVEELLDERMYDNGWWVYYKNGFRSCNDPINPTHMDHETTLTELWKYVKNAKPCTDDCERCTNSKESSCISLKLV